MNAIQSSSEMVCLPPDCCTLLIHDLPRAADLDAAMSIVNRVRQRLFGDGMLAASLNAGFLVRGKGVSPWEGDVIELQRIWTSNAQAYPVGGRKRKTMTPWTRQLLLGAEVFVGEGDVALEQAFDDHALLNSLGLHSIVNVPLLDRRGGCFATFNVSGTRAHWLPNEILMIRLLALLATPAILHAREAGEATLAIGK